MLRLIYKYSSIFFETRLLHTKDSCNKFSPKVNLTSKSDKLGNQDSSIRTVIKVSEKFDFNEDKTYISQRESSWNINEYSYPLIFQLILATLKILNFRVGASLFAISSFIEGHYGMERNLTKSHINRLLKIGVDERILKKVKGLGAAGRFKIKRNKRYCASYQYPLARRDTNYPLVSQMIFDYIQAEMLLRNATFKDIREYMEISYGVNLRKVTHFWNILLKLGYK